MFHNVLNRFDVMECCTTSSQTILAEDSHTGSSLNDSVLCCGGLLHTFQPGFHCCGNYYIRVLSGRRLKFCGYSSLIMC